MNLVHLLVNDREGREYLVAIIQVYIHLTVNRGKVTSEFLRFEVYSLDVNVIQANVTHHNLAHDPRYLLVIHDRVAGKDVDN